MIGLIIKLIVCPLVVALCTLLFTRAIYYPFLYQAVLVGIVLAAVGHMIEVLMLRRGTLWINTFVDFIAASALVYLSGFFVAGARVTLPGAVMTGLLLTVVEYYQHRWLIRNGMTQKVA